MFVGEEKDGKITGFHNWIQFFIEEIKGNLDYKGNFPFFLYFIYCPFIYYFIYVAYSLLFPYFLLHHFIMIHLSPSLPLPSSSLSPGYILPKRMNRHTELPDGDEHIISLQFSWGEETKSVSTSFLGVSPEFEVALYTMMFLASGERTVCELDGFRIAVR